MDTGFCAPIFVQSLIAPRIDEAAKEWVSQNERGKGSIWILDKRLSPADLYVYLKARFGPPNGIMMTARMPSTENFIQWHYMLKAGSFLFQILGLNTRTEFWISDYPSLGEKEWSELVEAIKKDFSRLALKLRETRDKLEKWSLFFSPYHRIKSIVDKCSSELAAITKCDFDLPSESKAMPTIYMVGDSQTKEFEEYKQKMKAISERYIRAQELSMTLRLVCPVWMEAFVNFVIFVLRRDELKADQRLYQDYIRKDIDLRVRLLHINCIGFEKPIDLNNQAYKDFHSIMNERNDLLHGNVDPERLSYETVYFDGTIPLFTEPQGLVRNSLGISLTGIEPAETLKRISSATAFIDFVLDHIEKLHREAVSMMLEKRELGWRSETKRLGILFPDFLVEGYTG